MVITVHLFNTVSGLPEVEAESSSPVPETQAADL